MKVLLLVCFLAATASALPNKGDFVPGEFMIRLNEKLVPTLMQEKLVIEQLTNQFQFNVLKAAHIGKLSFLHVHGADEMVKTIEELPAVKYIEHNNYGFADQVCEEQSAFSCWGLDRIDQREALPYTDPLNPGATYIHGEDTGSGVSAYIIDSGVEVEHSDFNGRARFGFAVEGMSDEDGLGHGTHCAGTVGSTSYGVAKDVEIVAVKVLNRFGLGTTDGFVSGAQWVLSDHIARNESSGVMPKSLASISLGYPVTDAIDDVVQELVDAGVTVISSAGNDDGDACGQSPARSPAALAIGM